MSLSPKPELAARRAAIALIEAALDHRGGFDEAMGRPPFTDLTPRDRAWARGLASAALRRLGSIDAALKARLQRPPPPEVMSILRIGAAQLGYRETPDFAAVATSVSLAEKGKTTKPFKGLVNAVLRRIAADGLPKTAPEADLPPWLFARWKAAYGEKTARALADRLVEEPPTDLTLRDPADAQALAGELEGEALPGGSLRTWRRGELPAWPGFEDGRWWVQDFAAAIPARLFDLKPGDAALDLCAAPGGKTLQLAATGATVVALDRSAPRLRRVSENLARMGLEAEVVVADGASWDDARRFDAVLLDAPCTATGTFRRHPDVVWGAKPGDIGKLAEVQARLLDAAARRVEPGGRLVYCVCSLEPEEGEAQAKAFLARHPAFSLVPVRPGEGGAPADAIAPEGWLRLLPSLESPRGGLDGFFVARFDCAR